ncbi:MAG: hypothetical protein DYG89_43885 [Caldilinea sp. CFX5]|nr:hypothetical protein [Caldilinea sp. CFX5]
MLLHEAIIWVLNQKGASSIQAIADAINSQQLYTRKDHAPVPTSQISARISNEQYRHLFKRRLGKVYLVSTPNRIAVQE